MGAQLLVPDRDMAKATKTSSTGKIGDTQLGIDSSRRKTTTIFPLLMNKKEHPIGQKTKPKKAHASSLLLYSTSDDSD